MAGSSRAFAMSSTTVFTSLGDTTCSLLPHSTAWCCRLNFIHYRFLAAGESQLKDHSCWMVCEMGEFTADRVRQQMGDFSKEHVGT
jgi:hypothetical protein